jgi:hypothetical protein
MPTTSDGTYTRVANSFSGPVTGTAIDPTDAEAFFDEVESEITDRLSRSGKGGMSANLSLDGNDVTDVDAVVFDGSSSGTATLRAPAAAGTTTVTLPDSTSTLATLALTETLSNKTLSLIPTGSAAAPSISFQSSNAGLYGGSDQVNIAVNGTQAFQAMYSGGTYYIGSPTQATGAFPEFTFEDGGRTKLRTRSLIIGDPGDTAEVGRYCGAGDPVTYTPWPGTSNGQQMALDYYTALAAEDDNPANYILANTYRTINPFRLSGASPFTLTRYMPSLSGYVDGMKIHVYWVANSPASPQVNINGWGNRELTTNAGASVLINNWAAGSECTFEYNLANTEFRAVNGGGLADSDSSAGRTDRDGFMNPNWARGAGFKTRMSQATTETSRPMDWIVETTRIGESVLRERLSVSNIGNTVVLGQGSYETAADIDGIDREDYYPGPLDNDANDDMYSGNYFAGNVGQHNGFRTPGAGSLTVIAPDEAMNSTIAIRKATEYNKGLDISYHHSGDRLLFQGAATSGSTVAVTGTASSGGLIKLTFGGAHSISRRDTVVVASVGGTTEANGVWTAWPTSTTELLLLGSVYENAWTAGGTIAKVTKTTYGTFKPDTGTWNFGGDAEASSIEVTRTSSQVNRLTVTGGATGNPAVISTGGETDVGLLIQSKGDSTIRFLPGGVEQARISRVSSAVNYVQIAGGTTGNPARVIANGSDTNIDLGLLTTGTGVVRFGVHTGGGDTTSNGYITIKDAAGNTRKLMTTA